MKMKKFINSPETVTDELIAGLGLAFSDILDVGWTYGDQQGS